MVAHIEATLLDLTAKFPAVNKTLKGYEFISAVTSEFDAFSGKIRLSTLGLSGTVAEADSEHDAGNAPGFAIPGGLRSLITHEFGHALDHAIRAQLDEDGKDRWFDAKRELQARIPPVSDYAKKNTSEWFAEQFTAECLNVVSKKSLLELINTFTQSPAAASPSPDTLPASIQAEVDKGLAKAVARWPSLAGIRVEAGDPERFTGNSSNILATKSKTAISYNGRLFADPSFWPVYVKEWTECAVDPTPAGVIIHECGHVADGQLLDKLGAKRYNLFVARILPGIDLKAISNEFGTPYGQENWPECVAEMFALWVSGKPLFDNSLGQAQYDNAVRYWSAAKGLL